MNSIPAHVLCDVCERGLLESVDCHCGGRGWCRGFARDWIRSLVGGRWRWGLLERCGACCLYRETGGPLEEGAFLAFRAIGKMGGKGDCGEVVMRRGMGRLRVGQSGQLVCGWN